MTNDTWEQKQAAERAERDAKIAERVARFDKIAELAGLGSPDNEREPDAYNATRIYKWRDGSEIYFHSGGYEVGWEKMRVSCSRPRNAKREYVHLYEGSQTIRDTSATMTLSKTDEKLAEEVKRRVLVPFAPILDKVLERINAENEYTVTTCETLESLKGEPLTEHERESRKLSFWETGKPTIHIQASRRAVTVFEAKYIDLKTAKKLLAILRADGVRAVDL